MRGSSGEQGAATPAPGAYSGAKDIAAEDQDRFDFFGPFERKGTARGLAVLAVAVVVGVLLMPSATRPPLLVTQQGRTSSASATDQGAQSQGAQNQGAQNQGAQNQGAQGIPNLATTSTTFGLTPTQTTTIAPSSIQVLVANGTNASGAAKAVGNYLTSKGFVLSKAEDALTTVSSSQVYPVGSNTDAAAEVAETLGLDPSVVQPPNAPPPVPSTAGATVVVVVGPDLAGRFVPGSSSTSTTTSTTQVPSSGA